eukprot:scaffold41135_cov64-Phaeocystis_antarctica.AAC.3
MVAALWAHPQVAKVQVHGCCALANVCWGDDDAAESRRQRAAMAGGLEEVVAAMQAHPEEENVQEEGCRALSNMCWGGTGVHTRRGRATQAGGLTVAVAAMQAHLQSHEVQIFGRQLLDCLPAGVDPAKGKTADCTRYIKLESVETVLVALFLAPPPSSSFALGAPSASSCTLLGSPLCARSSLTRSSSLIWSSSSQNLQLAAQLALPQHDAGCHGAGHVWALGGYTAAAHAGQAQTRGGRGGARRTMPVASSSTWPVLSSSMSISSSGPCEGCAATNSRTVSKWLLNHATSSSSVPLPSGSPGKLQSTRRSCNPQPTTLASQWAGGRVVSRVLVAWPVAFAVVADSVNVELAIEGVVSAAVERCAAGLHVSEHALAAGADVAAAVVVVKRRGAALRETEVDCGAQVDWACGRVQRQRRDSSVVCNRRPHRACKPAWCVC